MKIKTKIPPGRFVCGDGPVKAEGKKARPAFCYRIKRGGPKGHEKAMVEFHSKVSGKKIGYLSKLARLPLALTKAEAGVWPTTDPDSEPGPLQNAMRNFIQTGQDPEFSPTASPVYKRVVRNAWKIITKAARTP